MKASLCLEAAERPQWPRLYSLGRPRPCDRMPSLVGDRGPVLRVPGWALTRMYRWYYAGVDKKAEEWLCVGWYQCTLCRKRPLHYKGLSYVN